MGQYKLITVRDCDRRVEVEVEAVCDWRAVVAALNLPGVRSAWIILRSARP